MSTIRWFGPIPPGAQAHEDLPVVPTPVGASCDFCHGPIDAGDSGVSLDDAHWAHAECYSERLRRGREGHCQNCHLLAHLAKFARRDVTAASRKAPLLGPDVGVFVNLDPDPFEVFLADVPELLEALPTKNHPEVIEQARTEIKATPAEGMVRVLFVRGGCFLNVHAPVLSQEEFDAQQGVWRNEDMFAYVRELAPKIEGLGQPGKVLALAPKVDPIVAKLAGLVHVSADIHVSANEWQAKKESEREEATHPCDDWQAATCMCKGSCSCHWVSSLYVAVHDVADLLEALPLDILREQDISRLCQRLSYGQRMFAINGNIMSTDDGWWV